MKNYIFDEKIRLEEDFFYGYSPRCESFTKFDLGKNYVVNRINKNVDAGFDYVSISLKQKVSAPISIETQCEFDNFGAPLIVIAEDVLEKNERIFYGKHVEIVAYEEGINVWYIEPDNVNITNVKLLGQKKFLINENERFCLSVIVANDEIIAKIGSNEIIVSYKFPKEFFVGITACEGVNKFYNFKVEEVNND